jgi:hypothetical protein
MQLKRWLVLSKITIYLSLRLLKGRPSYRRSLQLLTKKIQHFHKNRKVSKFKFLTTFALLDPDPDLDQGIPLNADP